MDDKDTQVLNVVQDTGPTISHWFLALLACPLIVGLFYIADIGFETARTIELYQELDQEILQGTKISELRKKSHLAAFLKPKERRKNIAIKEIESALIMSSKDNWSKVAVAAQSKTFPKLSNIDEITESFKAISLGQSNNKMLDQRKYLLASQAETLQNQHETIIDDISSLFLEGREIAAAGEFSAEKDDLVLFKSGKLADLPRISGLPNKLEGKAMLKRFIRPKKLRKLDTVLENLKDRTKLLQHNLAKYKMAKASLEKERVNKDKAMAELHKQAEAALRKGLSYSLKPKFSKEEEKIYKTIHTQAKKAGIDIPSPL